ncbi:spermatogenesis-associated protein 13 isoform X1 [Tachysurus vachellii]|uniref:spermatogenesis-associated protein 13 isoform X1 n=1 Tax=Tachysurus vachellii TaxID=175792 RepID=UPI00296B45BC|nr:spermatogenesis-associated protein 13 isoform X1 [Tachysurus vachellii]
MRKTLHSDGASAQGRMSLVYPSIANGASLDHHTEATARLSCSSFEPKKRENSGAPVRPVHPEACCEKRGLNGTNDYQWSNPSIVDAQDTSHTTKNVRIFSFQRKCGAAGPEKTPLRGPGLHFMGSFKKLRSSVLQGIQNRGGVTLDNQEKVEESNGFFVTKRHFGSSQTNGKEMPTVSNGVSPTVPRTCVLDVEDDDDEDGCGLQRNSHFSRSIRRAYGAGRISLMDNARKQSESPSAQDPASRPRPCSTVESIEPNDILDTDVNALSRLSKSADNLHVYKSPFKRKVPSSQTQNLEDPSTKNFQRTSSASSVVMQDCVSSRCRGVTGVRGKMLKLVGSLTDLSANRKPNSDPTSAAALSALTQLHDDYSRRTPCVPASERQRRPPPSNTGTKVQADVHNHTPFIPADALGHITVNSSDLQVPQCSTATAQVPSSFVQIPVSSTLCSDISITHSTENCGTVEEEQNLKIDVIQDEQCTSPGHEQKLDSIKVNLECIWKTLERESEHLETPSGAPSFTDLVKENDEKYGDSVFVSPPVTPTCASASPLVTAPTSPASSCDTPIVSVPRRRTNRNRPRPISDYGQLICRKYAVPKEEVELQGDAQEERNATDAHAELHNQETSCENGHMDSRRRRPISVIGGVDLFASPDEKEDADLPTPVVRPPVPSHGVPPYRAVSARLRPCVFSQSTPTGLDRVGWRKPRRVLSDGNSGPDDCVSEEDGSFDELTDGTPYLQPEVDLSTLNQYISSGHVVYAEALWDHVTMGEQELAFKAGDVIRVLDAQEKDWWWGLVGERQAWFPSSFVRVRVNQEDSPGDGVENSPEQQEALSKEPRSQTSEHREQMRANVVQEIMNTERVYIKHLRDICEGYIRQCRKHPGMFTDTQLKTIFSNIEEIYKFQRKFLKDLEKNYDKENPHLSEIGSCFLQQGEGFSIYSEYCNTHPAACTELQRLMKQGRYKHFFEACRLLQQMIDISIAGFLLTPVQKICKYPLQLGELLKYTPKGHSDYAGVCKAHEAMKNVASLINERKRRLESIDTIAHWQEAIVHWEGEDVLSRSSELIHSGELTRVVRAGKTQQRSCFLFDHQLVFCKKDVLWRDLLHYRGRLNTDILVPLDLPDGRHPDLGTLRNAVALRNHDTLEVLCVLSCRKAQDKQLWLEAFSRERRRVKEDQEMGMEISETQRKQAIQNARKSKQGKMKNIKYAGHPVSHHHQPLHPVHQRHITVPTSIPQQQVFSLAEPKRKPAHLWYTFTRNALFRK